MSKINLKKQMLKYIHDYRIINNLILLFISTTSFGENIFLFWLRVKKITIYICTSILSIYTKIVLCACVLCMHGGMKQFENAVFAIKNILKVAYKSKHRLYLQYVKGERQYETFNMLPLIPF